MTKNLAIFALLSICIWFGSRIVVLEKYHYASQLNLCTENITELSNAHVTDFSTESTIALIIRDECLIEAETRTHWLWHLAYGLNIL